MIERKRKGGSTAYLAQIAIKRKGQWVHRGARMFAQVVFRHRLTPKAASRHGAAGDDPLKIKTTG
ncbi:hypothetical protein [Leisingera sp.]|uniref:hypothetical protein n=1 Tax=Leisingera sp. TaxID=1879318 RepID=UPI003A8D1F1E